MLKQGTVRLLRSINFQHHIDSETLVQRTIFFFRFQIRIAFTWQIEVSRSANHTVIWQACHLEVVGCQQTI